MTTPEPTASAPPALGGAPVDGYTLSVWFPSGAPKRAADEAALTRLRRRNGIQIVIDDGAAGGRANALRGDDDVRRDSRSIPADVAGTWLVIANEADPVDPAYYEELATLLSTTRNEVCLVSTNIQREDARSQQHPLAPNYAGDMVLDLEVTPNAFPVSLETTAFRVEEVRRMELRLDGELAPFFHGGDFTARYLLGSSNARVRFVASPALTAGERPVPAFGDREMFKDSRKFSIIPERGYLALLNSAGRRGDAPLWLQSMIVYELSWYMRADDNLGSQMNAEMHHVAERYHDCVAAIRGLIDEKLIDSVAPRVLPRDRYFAFRYGYGAEDWCEGLVVQGGLDRRKGLVKLTYFFSGTCPQEVVMVDGREAACRYSKTRAIRYAGKLLVNERILWVSAHGSVQVFLDGEPMAIVSRRPVRGAYWAQPSLSVRERPAARMISIGDVVARLLSPSWWRDRLLKMLAKSSRVRRRSAGSWIFMDRVDRGGDNAEQLFKYVQRHRTDIRAWFAVDRRSPDWRRLKSEGVRRVLPYGSTRWKLVCANATHVISSQAGPYVYNPEPLHKVGVPRWTFIFLQHGVIHTNLARWLNLRNFQLFVTTTRQEYAAIAGNGATYRFSPKEVALTGQPRHDRLLALDRQQEGASRRWLLVMPTWRDNLLGKKIAQSGEREKLADFKETTYARHWVGLLNSDRLREVAEREGLRIVFLPHPNVEQYLPDLELAPHVKVITYASVDVQQVFIDSALVITDYSSAIFDVALIRRALVYYQFDYATVFGGELTGRQGYFTFPEYGFGPVATTEEELFDAVDRSRANEFQMEPLYHRRVDDAFVALDGRASERVVAAIEDLDAPLSPDEARVAVETPQALLDAPTPGDSERATSSALSPAEPSDR